MIKQDDQEMDAAPCHERRARPLPGGMRLTLTERCELYDWKDACIAEEVARAVAAEREAAAERAGEFAKKWWSIHCASNKHMETTRKAHEDFCALQSSIRARSNAEFTRDALRRRVE